MTWIRIGSVGDFPEGQGRAVLWRRWRIAVFRWRGRLYAIGHDCPHQGGPLSQGVLDGPRVVCPLHGWDFDVRTGQSPSVPGASVPTFPVEERDGAVYLWIDEGTRGQ